MKIKISANSPGVFAQVFEHVMNAACVIAMSGYIPNEFDRKNPQQSGRYWFRDNETPTKVHLYPASNDYWAFLSEEDEMSVVVEFRSRYGRLDFWEHSARTPARMVGRAV